MATKLPLVTSDGRIEELQSGDLLAGREHGGAVSILFTFSTTTADADPGSGNLRLDNATQSSATVIRADDEDANATDWSAVINDFSNALTGQEAYIRLSKVGESENWLVFLTTQTVNETGYSNIFGSVVASSSTNPFSDGDPILLTYTRNGIDGSDAAITPGTSDNAIVRADGTSNDAIQGSTVTIDDAGTLTLTNAAANPHNFQVFVDGSGTVGTATVDASGDMAFEAGAGRNILFANAGQSAFINIGPGGGFTIQAAAGANVVFNQSGTDADFNVHGASVDSVLQVDASQNSARFASATSTVGIAVFRQTDVVFNEEGADRDFRVEGDTLTHMIFADATSTTENIALLAGAAPNWQSMDGGLFIADGTTVPAGNPVGGGFLYVESGALKWRGSSGTITTLGAA